MGDAYRKAVAAFAEHNDIPVIRFRPGERKLDVIRPYLDAAETPGVVAIGVAQETQRVMMGTDVDTWLSSGVKARYKIRGFAVWAWDRQLCQKLVVPVWGSKETPNGPVDHEARWALARRLLHDDTIDPGDRVAGALVVIYAQRLSNIAKLTSSDVVERDEEIFIRLGKEDVLMPGPLGVLLRDLPWRRQIGIGGKLHTTEWLFPGRQAGRHQHPDYLRVRLGALGIECRAQRRAALLHLASEVPASVLADTLNLAPSTASKWVDWAGGTWTNYVAERTGSNQGRKSVHSTSPGTVAT